MFAGVVDTDQSLPAAGVYLGDSGAVTRTVAPGTSIQVNLNGEQVFGAFDSVDPANGNLFQVLDQLALDIRAGDFDEMSAGMTRVVDASNRVAIAQAEIGTRARQIDGLDERNGDVSLAIQAELSEVEDVDYAKALIEHNSREFAYQAALSVTAKIIQRSLLDFLR